MEFEAVIGLEVHVQLNTETKIFCSCSTEFGAPPNTHICPICTGQPGVLPVLNKKVVEYAIKAALALNCEVADFTKFDRKNYFYPDLPKAYQISQYDLPIGNNGYIYIMDEQGNKKRIGITRLHMEEDAGKLVHSSDDFTQATFSFVDYNRGGVPLLEIVSEPDLRTPQEAYQYLTKLKTIMRYIGVSDCNMEEGSLRCDANVSVRPKGSTEFGTKTEVKNMNSFKNVMKALEYEIKRQIQIIQDGGTIVQETRLWDANSGRTFSMRSKEESHDYRYFPEPDLVAVVIDEAWKERIRKTLPEMPDEKKERFIREYNLPEYDAEVLTVERDIADYFESLAKLLNDGKTASNWVMGEVLRRLNERQIEIKDFEVPPEQLAKLINFVKQGKISNNIAKKVFEKMVQTKDDPQVIIEKEGLIQITDAGELEKIVEQVISAHPNEVASYKAGKTKVFGFFMGQIMKATKGKANPQLANQLLKKKLDE